MGSIWTDVAGPMAPAPTAEQLAADQARRDAELAAERAERARANAANQARRTAARTEAAKRPETVREQVQRLGNLAAHAAEVEDGMKQRGEMKKDAPPRDAIALYGDRGILQALHSSDEPKEVERELKRLEENQRGVFKRLLMNEDFFELAKKRGLVSGPAKGIGRSAFDAGRAVLDYASTTRDLKCEIDRRPGVDAREQRIHNANIPAWCAMSIEIPPFRIGGFEIWKGAKLGSLELAEGEGLPNVPGMPKVPVKWDKDGNITSGKVGPVTVDDRGTGEISLGPAKVRVNPTVGAVVGAGVPVGTLEKERASNRDALPNKIAKEGG